MTIFGRKSVKKSQKMMKKAKNVVYNAFSKTNWTYRAFFKKKKIVLANLKCINGYNMIKKFFWCHYFFPLGEVNTSFSNLLTRANNYRKFLCDLF